MADMRICEAVAFDICHLPLFYSYLSVQLKLLHRLWPLVATCLHVSKVISVLHEIISRCTVV